MIEIKIDQSVSSYIERLFYEQNAIYSIIEYLTAQKASADIIDKQVEKYSKVYAELEEAKRTTAIKYTPKPFNELDYYTFNFNNSSIEFYELSDKK